MDEIKTNKGNEIAGFLLQHTRFHLVKALYRVVNWATGRRRVIYIYDIVKRGTAL